jgi:hypothetical protein
LVEVVEAEEEKMPAAELLVEVVVVNLEALEVVKFIILIKVIMVEMVLQRQQAVAAVQYLPR